MNEKSVRLLEAYKYLESEDLVYNESDFARKIKYDKATVNQYLRGKKDPSHRFIHRIVTIYHFLSEQWILYGEGEMINQNNLKDSNKMKDKELIDSNVLETIHNLSKATFLQQEHIGELIAILKSRYGLDSDKLKRGIQ